MDQIDLALQEAWFRVGELCRANHAEALRRFQRCRRPSVSAPVRQWCLVLRASDTRIHSKHALIEALANARLGPDTGSDDLVRIGLPRTPSGVSPAPESKRRYAIPREVLFRQP